MNVVDCPREVALLVPCSMAQCVGGAPLSMTFTAARRGLSYQFMSINPIPKCQPHLPHTKGLGELEICTSIHWHIDLSPA